MNSNTLQNPKRVKSRRPRLSSRNPDYQLLESEAGSRKDLFERSLKKLADMLKPGMRIAADHYDCVLHVEVDADDLKGLLVSFLSRILGLTHLQKALFCSLNIEEFSETRIVAKVYGVWFGKLDNKLSTIDRYRSEVCNTANRTWSCSIPIGCEVG